MIVIGLWATFSFQSGRLSSPPTDEKTIGAIRFDGATGPGAEHPFDWTNGIPGIPMPHIAGQSDCDGLGWTPRRVNSVGRALLDDAIQYGTAHYGY